MQSSEYSWVNGKSTSTKSVHVLEQCSGRPPVRTIVWSEHRCHAARQLYHFIVLSTVISLTYRLHVVSHARRGSLGQSSFDRETRQNQPPLQSCLRLEQTTWERVGWNKCSHDSSAGALARGRSVDCRGQGQQSQGRGLRPPVVVRARAQAHPLGQVTAPRAISPRWIPPSIPPCGDPEAEPVPVVSWDTRCGAGPWCQLTRVGLPWCRPGTLRRQGDSGRGGSSAVQCRIAGNVAADSDECSALQCSDVLEYRLHCALDWIE